MRFSSSTVRAACAALVVFLASAPACALAQPAVLPAAGEPAPINMQIDQNGDQLPDQLVAELKALEWAANLDHEEDAEQQDITAVMKLVARLPLSDATLAAQAEAQELMAELAAEQDPVVREALSQQVDQLLERAAAADPNYRLALQTVETLAATEASPFGAPNRVYLPAIQGGQATAGSLQGAAAQGGPDFSRLRRGHIMFIRGDRWYLNWIYARTYSHAGVYNGNSMVYESQADGVKLQPLAHWQEPGHQVGLGYNNQRSEADVQAALDWAETTYKTDGATPYNYVIPDKWTDSKLYCSQLVWKIHSHLGVDLDSNNFWYITWISLNVGAIGTSLAIPGVMPDEVALSDYVTIYSAGVTQ